MWISYFPLFLLHSATFLVAPLVALPEKFFDSKSLYRELHKLDHDDRWERFTSLHSGQHYFDLPVAGSHNDCDFDEKDGHERGCQNWIFTISRHEKYPEMFSTLPTVLLMAGIEGDDAMGTTALVETARLLLEAISCSDGLIFEDQEHKCPSHKHPEAMQTIVWLANLVSTRRIIIVPAVNSLGLYKKTLSENGKHPETDFPSKETDGCFETITARTINGLFRKHLIQLSLSFRTLEKSDDIYDGHGFPRLASTNDNLESGDKAGWDALVQGLQLYGKNNHDIHIDYSSKPLGHYYDERGMEYWSYRGCV